MSTPSPKKRKADSPKKQEILYDSQHQRLWEVERILNHRHKPPSEPEYLIKWLGYPSSKDNSWEPASGLHCDRLLSEYWKEKTPQSSPVRTPGTGLKIKLPVKRLFSEAYVSDVDSDDIPLAPPPQSPQETPRSSSSEPGSSTEDENEQRETNSPVPITKKGNASGALFPSEHSRVHPVVEADIMPSASTAKPVSSQISLHDNSSQGSKSESWNPFPHNPGSGSYLLTKCRVAQGALIQHPPQMFALVSGGNTIKPTQDKIQVGSDDTTEAEQVELEVVDSLPNSIMIEEEESVSETNLLLPEADSSLATFTRELSESLPLCDDTSITQEMDMTLDSSTSALEETLLESHHTIHSRTASLELPKEPETSNMQEITVGNEKISCIVIDICSSQNEGLTLQSILETVLHIRTFHSSFLDAVLSACSPGHALAYLADITDSDCLGKWAHYMTSKNLISFVPVQSGLVLIFPLEMEDLVQQFSDICDLPLTSAKLCAVLCPWLLQRQPGLGSIPAFHHLTISAKGDLHWPHEEFIDTSPRVEVHHALRILKVNQQWLNNILDSHSSFLVLMDEKASVPKIETTLLLSIIDSHPNKLKRAASSSTESTRLIFVHVAILPTINQLLPDLVQHRSHVSDTIFILFGTTPTIPARYWTVQHLFPYGGIVTFTPQAFLDNPKAMCEKLTAVASHPLWAVYVMPSVLGMAMILHQRARGRDYKRPDLVFEEIFEMIEQGEVALMRAPHRSCQDIPWCLEQTECILRNAEESLEFCVAQYELKYGEVIDNDCEERVRRELLDDLHLMQIQPAICTEYRRFVVLESEVSARNELTDSSDGFEHPTLSQLEL